MSYLLDTNIISETVKTIPNLNVMKWLETIPSEDIFISVITIGEIKKGIELLEQSKRKALLIKWLEYDLPNWFAENILVIDKQVAEKWGYLSATYGSRLPAIDGLIAATALSYNLKLVTRNEKDFQIANLEVINPFM